MACASSAHLYISSPFRGNTKTHCFVQSADPPGLVTNTNSILTPLLNPPLAPRLGRLMLDWECSAHLLGIILASFFAWILWPYFWRISDLVLVPFYIICASLFQASPSLLRVSLLHPLLINKSLRSGPLEPHKNLFFHMKKHSFHTITLHEQIDFWIDSWTTFGAYLLKFDFIFYVLSASICALICPLIFKPKMEPKTLKMEPKMASKNVEKV